MKSSVLFVKIFVFEEYNYFEEFFEEYSIHAS